MLELCLQWGQTWLLCPQDPRVPQGRSRCLWHGNPEAAATRWHWHLVTQPVGGQPEASGWGHPGHTPSPAAGSGPNLTVGKIRRSCWWVRNQVNNDNCRSCVLQEGFSPSGSSRLGKKRHFCFSFYDIPPCNSVVSPGSQQQKRLQGHQIYPRAQWPSGETREPLHRGVLGCFAHHSTPIPSWGPPSWPWPKQPL